MNNDNNYSTSIFYNTINIVTTQRNIKQKMETCRELNMIKLLKTGMVEQESLSCVHPGKSRKEMGICTKATLLILIKKKTY
jgi:hypothetical protein